MKRSTTYQVLIGRMGILRRDQSENQRIYRTKLCTRKKFQSGYGIIDLVWIIETINLSVPISRYESGRTPLEYITGETTNIIEYLDYTFYDWITYRANSGLGELLLGRWLGVSHKFVQYIQYWILPVSGTVTSYTMV